MAFRRTLLAVASALLSINMWTGGPLLALWAGSRYQASTDQSGPTMTAIFVVVLVLAVVELALTVGLTRASAAYDELTGRPAAARRTSPWLRSMRGEREELTRRKHGISGIERIVVLSVVGAVLAFEIWFFFFAGSSLPKA